MSAEGDDDATRILRERRPTPANRQELLELMAETRIERRHWIASSRPSITDILQTYPRFQDMDTAVSSSDDTNIQSHWIL